MGVFSAGAVGVGVSGAGGIANAVGASVIALESSSVIVGD